MTDARAGATVDVASNLSAERAGPDCLLLHGFGSDRLSWMGTTPAIAPARTVHAFDLPGHGEAGPDVGDGMPVTLADRVAAAIDALGIGRAHIVGHSLGGGIALLLAQRRPDLVASLVLIAPAGLGAAIDHDFLQAYPRLDDTAAATLLLHRLVARPQLIGRQVVQRALDQLARPGVRAGLERVAAGLIAGQADIERAAAAVGASALPRMVIWGEADRINLPPSPDGLARFGGEQHQIAATGHLPHIESAKLVNGLLAAFLARAPRNPAATSR